MSDDISFQSMDSYRGSKKFQYLTFNQIVLQHINRCVVNGSVEWKGGYWETVSQIKSGLAVTEKRYMPSTLEVYNNSIRQLRACLMGYFDDKIKKTDSEIQERIKKLNKEDKLGRVEISIELFEQLVMLLKRLNFFEEESSEEEL